jgi:diadenosine tetraphosphatase ApaH/serine/threonine PP2A family protein phosphatase
VASHAFTHWLSANMRALVGSESELHQLVAPYMTRHALPHGCDFAASFKCLAEECLRLLKLQPMLVRTQGHTKVYGDIHGQLADILALFREHGFPSNRRGGDIELVTYVFDGDFVDRGPQQVEVVLLLFSLKVAFPDRIVLLRGNHEFREMNQCMGADGYGFHIACGQHPLIGSLGHFVYDLVCDVFDWLPFAALVEESVLVVHGGIGDGRWAEDEHQTDISWLSHTECRPVRTLFDRSAPDPNCIPGSHRHRSLLNIVWSDPITDAKPSEWQPHYCNGRGPDILKFSSEATEDFCARNHISMVIRGHEVAQGGYEMLHNGHLCTVFSARNYCGFLVNDAALVLLQPDLDGHLQVKFKTLQHLM